MNSKSLFPLYALALALTSGCVDSLSEERRPCPCTDGWTCCASTQTCVADGTTCPSEEPKEEEVPPRTPDVVPPVTPVLKASIPGSPTASATVTLDGTTEPGAAVALFTTADCSGAPVGSGTANAAGDFRVSVSLSPNTSTSFWARATDAASNASHCSAEPLTVLHDGVAPERPVLESLTPAPLSRTSTHPVLAGIAEPRSTVQLFADGECLTALPFSATADDVGAFRIWASVDADTATTFHARAVDAAGNASPCSTTSLAFTHDGTPPAAPELAGPVTYVKSAESDATGTAEAGTQVQLFAEPDCAGEPVGTSTTLPDGTFAVRFAPRRNTPNALSTRATDAAGNTSACSATHTFVHDDIPPPVMPEFLRTEPSSPSNSRTPSVKGATEEGATVRIYLGAGCSAAYTSKIYTTVANSWGSFSLPVEVTANGWTSFSVDAVDAAGNVSACVTTTPSYLHDGVAPPPPQMLTASSPMPYTGSANWFSLYGMAEAGATIQLYDNPTCAGTPLGTTPTSTPKNLAVGDFSGWVELLQRDTSVELYATARDAAGNTSACSSTSVKVARTSSRGWGEAALVGSAIRPVLGLNTAGQALAVWRSRTTDAHILASFSTPTGWTQPTQLSGDGASPGVDAALSDNGHAFAVWNEWAGSELKLWARAYVPGQDWQPAQTLSSSGFRAAEPTVAADAAGNALALWLEYVAADSTTMFLWAARFTPQGGWERAQRLSTGTATPPRLTMSASGHAWAFWGGSREGGGTATWSSHYTPGQGWSAPETLEIPVWRDSERYVAAGADEAGGVMVAWTVPSNGFEVWARRFVPGEGWGTPRKVSSQAGAYLSLPRLAVNARGEALVAWVNEAQAVTQQSLWAARFTPDTGWSDATRLQDGPGPFTNSYSVPEQLWVGLDGTGAGQVFFVRPLGTRLYGNTWYPRDTFWSTRFEPATGWEVPQLVGDGTHYVSMVMNPKGETLVTWDATGSQPLTSSRWYR